MSMNRPRKKDRHLPPCVYKKHNAYYLVRRGVWTRLAAELPAALREYARIYSQPAGGMSALIEDALPSIIAGKAPATVKLYTLAARKLQATLIEFAPEQVTAADVAQMRRAWAGTPSMANRCQAVLKLVFDYALDERLVALNPCVGAKRLTERPRTRRITQQEFAAVHAAASPRLRIVMTLCYLTGQRIGDVLSIRREHLTEEGIVVRQTKTKALVTIAWSPELVAAVAAAKAAHGPVSSLWLVKGTGSARQAHAPIWRDWRAACAAAGVDEARLHDLRAMAASDAKQQGLNAQSLLGHKSQRMTDNYLRDRESVVVQGPSIRRKPKVLDGT
jgi:integrase